MLVAGLQHLGFSARKINRVLEQTNQVRLIANYGINSTALAQLWEDLQTTTIPGARLDVKKRDLKMFFCTMNFLRRYHVEKEREAKWYSDRKNRDDGWYYVQKIGLLKGIKITWPFDNFGDDIWCISVDGTHFRTYEKRSATLNLDPSIFSYKNKCAGFNYEIGLSINESKLVWFNGPFEAGTYNDAKIFNEKGLRAKLQQCAKCAIGDGGYRGYRDCMSTPNIRYDDPEVRKFKTRVRMRHERYNAMLKSFKCLSDDFRSSKEKLQLCFEAVAVICQYKMEFGEPLFDV